MRFETIEDLKKAGFEGFKPVCELYNNDKKKDIPNVKGIYMVVYPVEVKPEFLTKGTGGFFKGTDPNVSIEELEHNWVEKTSVVYIGQAGGNGSKATLRKRVWQYLRFGDGKNVGHKGGRYIWQLKDSQDLLFCWKPLPNDNPATIESDLIRQFKEIYGDRPFANLKD